MLFTQEFVVTFGVVQLLRRNLILLLGGKAREDAAEGGHFQAEEADEGGQRGEVGHRVAGEDEDVFLKSKLMRGLKIRLTMMMVIIITKNYLNLVA